jgi:hypothetical protein
VKKTAIPLFIYLFIHTFIHSCHSSLFTSISTATHSGITGSVDIGSGSLPASSEGSASWLIIPTREAAPEATYYDFSGSLTYTLDGVDLVEKLWPGKS